MFKLSEILGLNRYISKLDQFITYYDRENPKLSASQIKEKEKYARIYHLRDTPSEVQPPEKLWDAF